MAENMQELDVYRELFTGLSNSQVQAVQMQALTLKPITGIAKEIGINPSTIHRWMLDPVYRDAMDKLRAVHLREHRPDIDAAVINQAKDGDTKSQRLFYELSGDLQNTGKSSDNRPNIQINILDVPNQGRTIDITPDRKE